jgi:BASS family bile acid:Na+ symporter
MGLHPAIFGTWMDISGSFLANWWRKVPVDDENFVEN